MVGRKRNTILDKIRTATFIKKIMEEMCLASPTSLGRELMGLGVVVKAKSKNEDKNFSDPEGQARLWARGKRILTNDTAKDLSKGVSREVRKPALREELYNIFARGPDDLWFAAKGQEPASLKNGPQTEMQKLAIHIYIMKQGVLLDKESVLKQNLLLDLDILPSCVPKVMYLEFINEILEEMKIAHKVEISFPTGVEEKIRQACIQSMLTKERPDRLFLDKVCDELL